MKNLKKLFIVFSVITMVMVIFTACGNNEDEPDATPTPAEDAAGNEGDEGDEEPVATSTPTPTPPPRDLGGINILVGDWFSTGVEELDTQKQIDQKAYREELQKEHNFTITQENIAGWNDYVELFSTSTMSGNPAADVFIMDLAFVPEPLKQGLCYPVSDLPSFNNFEDNMWNQATKESYTQEGKVYAFSEESITPGLGVFWNKRLFEEAGLDPDYLYDLQASGDWDWEIYREIAIQCTQDKDSDGVAEVYGLTGWQRELVKAAVFSNGADYVRFNEETGRYENNQTSDEVLAAIELAVDMYDEGVIKPTPEDANYTFFVDVFNSGEAAMCTTEWYRHTEFQNMEDDFGFVFFPKGPADDAKMQTMYVGNVRVMPADMDPQRADDVAFAYSKHYGPVPGYEDDEMDLSNYYAKVRDSRAVEETIIPMLNGQGVRSLVYMVPGLSFKHGANEDDGGLGDISAIEIAEAASANYDALISDFYAE